MKAYDHVFSVCTFFPLYLYLFVYFVMYFWYWDFVCFFSVVNPEVQNGISFNEVRGLIEE